MGEIISVNEKNCIIGLDSRGKRKEIVDIIDEYMGDEFAKYVDEYIGELEEKSDKAYWQNRSDEQVYEEELNEIHSMLNEVWDYLHKIKLAGAEYKKMPKWGYIAADAMKLIEGYM